MPTKVKTADAAQTALNRISPAMLDELVTGPMTQDGIEEAMRGFKKALIERVLGAEMSAQLGYANGAAKPPEITAVCLASCVQPHYKAQSRCQKACHTALDTRYAIDRC